MRSSLRVWSRSQVGTLIEMSRFRTIFVAALLLLARRSVTALMQPRILRLRRLVMANADRFPDVGRSWYEQGFERALATLARSTAHF
jgi:hypothetical protein